MGKPSLTGYAKGGTVRYLEGDESSLRVNVQLSRQDAELYDEGLLHLHLPVRKDPQLYGPRRFLSVPEKEGSVHRLPDVCVEWRQLLPAVGATDAPGHL